MELIDKSAKRAMEHCCAKCVHDKFGCSMKVLHNGRDCIKCGNYIKGYQQAEKDLANARDETIKEVCEWLDNHTILSEKWYIEDLKKHFNNMK